MPTRISDTRGGRNFVPPSWPLTAAPYATQLVFADANATLNAREPADANFLDATSCEARVPSVRGLLTLRLDEMFRQRVWEPSRSRWRRSSRRIA